MARVSDSDFTIFTRPHLQEPDLTPTSTSPSRWLITAFVDDQISFSERSTLEIGSRFSLIPSHKRVYLEPRISWQQDLEVGFAKSAAYKISAGIYRQFTSQFDLAPYTASALLPSFRFWIPTGKQDRPPYSFHVASQTFLEFMSWWSVEAEYFLKYTPRMLVLNYALTGQTPIADARERSMGASISTTFRSSTAVVKAWYSTEYSLMRQEDRFDGKWISTPWEIPHRVGISGDVSVTPNLKANAILSASIGRAWGYRLSYYNYLPLDTENTHIDDLHLTDPEAQSLPDVVRLDLGISYSQSVLNYDLVARLSALNLLNRKNTIDWMLQETASEEGTSIQARSSLPQLFLFSLQVTMN